MILALFVAYLKIGFLGFGGGYAMLALILSESEHLGITATQFADLNVLDGMIPGPVAINSATYVGQLTAGLPGAIVATLTVCIPSLIFVPLYMHYESKINADWRLSAILSGIKPASAGLIGAVAITITLSTVAGIDSVWQYLQAAIDWPTVVVLVVVIWLDLKTRLNPLLLIVLAGVIGAIGYYI